MKPERYTARCSKNGQWYTYDNEMPLNGPIFAAETEDQAKRFAKRMNQKDSPSGFKAAPTQEGW